MKMRFPTYWIGDGTEVKESSAAVVGGRGGTEEIDLKPPSARKLRVKGRRRNTDLRHIAVCSFRLRLASKS